MRSDQLDAMSSILSVAGTAATGITGSMLGAQNAASQWVANTSKDPTRDNDVVGVFKVLRAEDGFVIRCAPDEGYKYKTFVASTIDEAMDKVKAFMVSEALK